MSPCGSIFPWSVERREHCWLQTSFHFILFCPIAPRPISCPPTLSHSIHNHHPSTSWVPHTVPHQSGGLRCLYKRVIVLPPRKLRIYLGVPVPVQSFIHSSSVSRSLRPHGLQHARLPCPSPAPRACSNSCPSGWWCHPTISSSVAPFSSCLQSFQASGSFPMFFTLGGPKYWSFSFSISPSNEFSGLISFGIDWFDLLAVQGILKSPLQHHSSKASILWCSAFLMVQPSHPFRPSF